MHRQSIASAHGLTVLQLDLLGILATGLPLEPTVSALAREVGVSQPTTTESLHALRRKELVTLVGAPQDRRRRRAELTADGRRLADAAAAEEDTRTALARLPRDEQEQTLETLLRMIATFVDSGIIRVARTCLTCHFHRSTPAGGHYCTLLEEDLGGGKLRLDCPEHQPAG